jgi:hypothetical protein
VDRNGTLEGSSSAHKNSYLPFAFLTGLMVGTLDGTAAIIDFLLSYHGNPIIGFQFIASGVFGAKAFSGGLSMALLGILFHYVFALSWTILFFVLYPKLELLSRNWFVSGLLYAIVVWVVMNLVIRPMSHVPPIPLTASRVIKSAAILMLVVGSPISFVANRFYTAQLDQR